MSIQARLTLVWAFVSGLTVLAWWLATHGEASRGFNIGITVGVMVIALVKAHFIIREFMEVRLQLKWIRWLTALWLTSLFAACLALYLYAALPKS